MNHELWNRILNFNLDNPDAEFNFSMRLARDNGWTKTHADRVIKEYKRFLYLYCEAGHPVTPSDEVDQAWHLHLCYTESYWHDLCRDTLKRPIHHGPTKGGKSEREKFRDWYNETLASYESTFGEKPPDDCWPTARKRFASLKFERIDRGSHFVIPKRAAAVLLMTSAALILLTSCDMFGEDIGESTGFFLLLIIPIIILVSFLGKSKGGGGSSCGGGHGCGGGCGSGCGGCGS